MTCNKVSSSLTVLYCRKPYDNNWTSFTKRGKTTPFSWSGSTEMYRPLRYIQMTGRNPYTVKMTINGRHLSRPKCFQTRGSESKDGYNVTTVIRPTWSILVLIFPGPVTLGPLLESTDLMTVTILDPYRVM